ncbi:hypothetical protein NZK35_15725 [Stieleria sp. ICT_E10.1]|nr:hypothetical protein [Stieleria sedimenti]MCS7468101.1 hypothetical protein [Stieleria sedimenti]
MTDKLRAIDRTRPSNVAMEASLDDGLGDRSLSRRYTKTAPA